MPRLRYRIGLPRPGKWRELLNSDAAVYGGSNMGNLGGVLAAEKPWHNQPCSADFILPPLSILAFRPERAADKGVANPQAEPEKADSNPPSGTESFHTKLLADVAAQEVAEPHKDPASHSIGRLRGGNNTAQGNALGISPPPGVEP